MPITRKSRPPTAADRAETTRRLDPRAIAEQVRLFLILLLGQIVVAQVELPFRLAGIVLGIAALWLGIRLLVRMSRLRRIGIRPRGSVVVSVGLGLSLALVLMLAAEASYYPMAADLERCRSGANTATAQRACDNAARDRINRLIDRLNSENR